MSILPPTRPMFPSDYELMLESQIEGMQAKIDMLMLEFCPDEMTEEQLANWEIHQKALSESASAVIDMAIKDATSEGEE